MARSRYGGPYTPTKGPYAGREFPSYFRYRDQLARDAGYGSYYELRHGPGWSHEVRNRNRAADYYGPRKDGGPLRGKPDLAQLARKLRRDYPTGDVALTVRGVMYTAGRRPSETVTIVYRAADIAAEIDRILATPGHDGPAGPIALLQWLGKGAYPTLGVEWWSVRRPVGS